MTGGELIERPDWSVTSPAESVPAEGNQQPALTNIGPDPGGTIVTAGLKTAEDIEAGMSSTDAEAVNALVSELPESAKAKIRMALANRPMRGREGRWYDDLHKSFTLAERAAVLDAEDQLTPAQAEAIAKGLAR